MTSLLALALTASWTVSAGEPGAPDAAQAGILRDAEALAGRCAKGPFDPLALLAEAEHRAALGRMSGGAASELSRYAACVSLAGGADACPSLSGAGGAAAAEVTACRVRAAEARLARAALKGGDARAACLALVALDGKTAADAGRGCDILLSALKAGDATGACEPLRRAGLMSPGESCTGDYGWWSGSDKGCSAFSNAEQKRDCADRAALAGGLRTPARCVDSPYCRALSEQSLRACERLRERAEKAVCRSADAEIAAYKRVRGESEGKLAAARADAAAKEKAALAAKAAADAAIAKKAEEQALRALESKKKMERKERTQYGKGQPMTVIPKELQGFMKAVQEGKPPPPIKKNPVTGNPRTEEER